MNKLNLTIVFLALFLPLISFSQGWEKTYDDGFNEIVHSSKQTLDGGFIMTGSQYGNTNDLDYAFLYKTDLEGNLEWPYYDSTNAAEYIYLANIFVVSDGSYLFHTVSSQDTININASTSRIQKINSDGLLVWETDLSPYFNDSYTIYLEEASDGKIILSGQYLGKISSIKIDNNGDLLWQTTIPNLPDQLVNNGAYLTEYSNDEFIISNVVSSSLKLIFNKINANGDLLWQTIIPNPLYNSYTTSKTITTSNNDILILTKFPSTSVFQDSISLIKLNGDGDILWIKNHLMDLEYTTPYEMMELLNGEIIIGGSHWHSNINAPFSHSPFLLKLDGNGDLIWYQRYPTEENRLARYFHKTADGGFIMSGGTSTGSYSDIFLLKVDSLGNKEWENTYGRSKSEGSAGLHLGDDQYYYLTGYTQKLDDSYDAYLIKTDSLGFSLTNQLSGNIYFDQNENCDIDTSEIGMSRWLVQATQNDIEYHELTDSLGDYIFSLDTGTYQITAYPTTPYWTICNNNFDISFPIFFDTIVENIGTQVIIECPLLDVSIATPLLRRCFENTYYIQYCNYGTIDAEDAYVEITFATAMTILDSSIPVASQNGDIYTFELGDVPWGDCGYFTVDIMLGDTSDCEAIPLGTTHCVEAHIYPDSICLPSGSWSGASVEVDANCSGDTISFFIQNVGTATTQSNLQYIVVEDDVILFNGNFTLNPMENEIIQIATNGSTFRLEAEQEPNHPGMSMPSVTVEGCTVNNTTSTLGFLNIFSQDDGDTFVDIDCRQNIGAYDPNDKMGFPLGYGNEKYIDRGQDIEYQIRFQNTGTDTAFNIVVLDTLSEFLDITTIRPGASSHPYQFDISTGRVLSFTFNNIMLPDSFVNESASNGFVKFKVSQKPNLDLKTQIHNEAAIYFDFNSPIFTNQTLHTIGENFVIVSIDTPLGKSLVQVKVHPNPFTNFVNFEIEGLEIQNGNFKLFDAMGRLLREQSFNNTTFTFHKKELQTGIYFFTIEENGQLISNGKLIAQ